MLLLVLLFEARRPFLPGCRSINSFRKQAQHERQDNCFLRAENDKIRCENIAMREALRNVICPTCGGPPVADDYFDEQKMRMENARLKEEARTNMLLLFFCFCFIHACILHCSLSLSLSLSP
jgi:hypothetical protein